MTRKLGLSIGVCTAFLCSMACPGQSAASSDRAYDTLLAALKSGHTNIDYTAFRVAYAESSHYDPYSEIPAASEMAAAFKANDCRKVLADANKVLDADFTDIEAHVLAAECARTLNDTSTANFHHAVAAGLIGSIAHSGNGTTSQSPFVVIAVKEEYAFLSSQGYRVTTQALLPCGKGECDVMGVVGPSGATTFYFDVSRPMDWLTAKLAPRHGG